nr:hypothetical protein BaRGS_031701 [Batillaria attramentaria]
MCLLEFLKRMTETSFLQAVPNIPHYLSSAKAQAIYNACPAGEASRDKIWKVRKLIQHVSGDWAQFPVTTQVGGLTCWCGDDKDVALTRHGHTLLNVAIFAPYDLKFKFTLDRVLPAVVTAEQAVHRKQLLPGYRFHWIPGDSKCNSRDAAIHAFDTVTRYKMAFFLGPVCDYSLAPVARYAAYWNISVVAPGGFAHNFGTEKLDGPEGAEFPLLTRIGYTFNSMALTFLDLLTYYKWEKVKVLYRSSDHSDIVPAFCHLAGGALGEYLENEKRRKFDMHRIVEKTPEDYARMLLEQLDTQYAAFWA